MSANTSTLGGDSAAESSVEIHKNGDIVLKVTFETSKATLQAARRQSARSTPRASVAPSPQPKPTSTIAYRVRLETLKKTSKYFNQLLGQDKFKEGRDIAAGLADLRLKNINPHEAKWQDLPQVAIVDDDQATKTVGREDVFGDLLRILHGVEIVSKPSIPYLASLAVMADRFDCAPTVARNSKSALKNFKWPATSGKNVRDGGPGNGLSIVAEELLRQKILVAWILDHPMKLAMSSKELILRGSSRWLQERGPYSDAFWWDLPDGLEAELFHRRSCILTTIASLQSYFLRLYTSRKLQCKLFYDTSQACDSFQLGEMIKFFSSKGLLHLTSAIAYPHIEDEDYDNNDTSAHLGYYGEGQLYKGDIEMLIATLKECPNYQIDKNHLHCGLRNRIIAPLEYIQNFLSAGIGIERRGWVKDRETASWDSEDQSNETVAALSSRPAWRNGAPGHKDEDESKKITVFNFTRSIASRPKMDGMMASDRWARELFTAKDWDWSPEDI